MGDDPEANTRRVVRPYVLTGGRTRAANVDLPIDAPIVAVLPTDRLDDGASPEAQMLVRLCRAPTPVAELAARMRVPLGVTRVLIADLGARGFLAVAPSAPPDAHLDVTLLERLLDGIRAL
jgi:Protein of unknown function (DUF742)